MQDGAEGYAGEMFELITQQIENKSGFPSLKASKMNNRKVL